MKHKRKLIEVALPLEAISRESAREKSIRHGHPSTLHLWWARRPLAAARAVLWASLVDDPSSHPDDFPTVEDQKTERKRLFGILERLVRWESSNDQDILDEARKEIIKSVTPPPHRWKRFKTSKSWTRSAGAGRSLWRPNGWVSPPTGAT